MPVRALAYVSEAAAGLPSEKVGQIVEDAASFNLTAGVTGILLFDGARFLQYLEGPEDGISVAFQRVMTSTAHQDVVELNRGRVGRRQLPYWSMHAVRVEQLVLSKIAISDWTGFTKSSEHMAGRLTAIDQLLGVAQLQLSNA